MAADDRRGASWVGRVLLRNAVNRAWRQKPIVLPLVDVGPLPVIGECLACGHIKSLGVWKADTNIGICVACRDAAMPLRGPCSPERGCICGRSGT